MKCWSCGKEIDAADAFCRYCGAGQNKNVQFYYKPLGIIVLVFLIGPFALWFLFRSPVIGKKGKWIGGLVITLISIWFCYAFYKAFSGIFTIYSELLNTDFSTLPLM